MQIPVNLTSKDARIFYAAAFVGSTAAGPIRVAKPLRSANVGGRSGSPTTSSAPTSENLLTTSCCIDSSVT